MLKSVFLLNGQKISFSNLEAIDVTDFMNMIKEIDITKDGITYHYQKSYLDLDKKEFIIEIG